MSTAVLIDYGCHSFTYRLAVRLHEGGCAIRYFANGSLESPNQQSVAGWAQAHPGLVRVVSCQGEYGKMSLHKRLLGELQWASICVQALEQENPSVIILSCVPLTAVTRIQMWARNRRIPVVYWLQDLQGRAMHDLLGRKFGFVGRVVGSLADIWEQEILERSRMVITIAAGHEAALPLVVRRERRHALLENWANIEEFPGLDTRNDWSQRVGIDATRNIIYSGTLGFKHDLPMFTKLAAALTDRPDIRIVIVSSGEAAKHVQRQAIDNGLNNLVVLPFQPYQDVPKVLASAAVLIAPLDPSAGSFCVPSKILSYLCAGRPTVLAIDEQNPAARMITTADAGAVVRPGDTGGFISAIIDLLDSPQKALRQGRSARAYAENTFCIDSVVARFLKILNSADVNIGGSRTPAYSVGNPAGAWLPIPE
jgi:glycosyltransferase involved in cell wall biosynthesis